jgi:anti-anti-sigma regulatory factor
MRGHHVTVLIPRRALRESWLATGGESMRGAVQPEQYTARDPSGVRIMSIQPDREHAFVEVVGAFGHEGVPQLRERVEGLLIAGARYVLVDLSEAGPVEPSTSAALAPACRELAQREGWLRTVGHDSSSAAARYGASLADLFAMYQVAVRTSGGRAGGRGR